MSSLLLKTLSECEMDQVHEKTLDVFEKVGFKVTHDETIQRFQKAGADVSEASGIVWRVERTARGPG